MNAKMPVPLLRKQVRSLTGWQPEKEVLWESSRGVSRPGNRGGFRALHVEIPRGAPIAHRLVVLTGLSGTGKSAALAALAAAGEQVLDLQTLACHRGSAFGGFGMPPQPTHKDFQDTVRDLLAACDPTRALFVERCPRYLGSVGLPVELLEAMASAPTWMLSRSRSERIGAIVRDYGGTGIGQWRDALSRIRPRLGQSRATAVRAALETGDLTAAVDVLLSYYDSNYVRAAGGGVSRSLVGPSVIQQRDGQRMA